MEDGVTYRAFIHNRAGDLVVSVTREDREAFRGAVLDYMDGGYQPGNYTYTFYEERTRKLTMREVMEAGR